MAKLRRLQAATLVVLLGTLGTSIAARFDRPAAAPPPPPAAAPFDATPLLRSLAQLGSQVAALEAAARKGAHAVASYDRRASCRITNDRGGLAALVREPGQEAQRVELAGAQGPARIVVGRGLGPAEPNRHGLLVAQALVRTDNGIREKENHPHRLALACVERGGREQQAELAGAFFLAASQPQDLLRKTSANTCTFVVTEGSRLELVVDAPTLRSYLTEGGLLEVELRLGPLVVFDGPVSR